MSPKFIPLSGSEWNIKSQAVHQSNITLHECRRQLSRRSKDGKLAEHVIGNQACHVCPCTVRSQGGKLNGDILPSMQLHDRAVGGCVGIESNLGTHKHFFLR